MASNKFNFDSYNSIMKDANTGLKLHLGVQLIKDVVGSLEYFDNPLEAELRPVYVDLKAFQQQYKDAAKERAAKAENESERTKGVDNSTVPVLGIQDMVLMSKMFNQMLQAQKDGRDIEAQNAQTSIEQIQDGVLHQQGDAVQQ